MVTDRVYWTTLKFLWSTKDIQYPTQSYHHGLHNCEVWQKHIILHDVTRHFTELPQVAFHTIDQHLTTCIFGSINSNRYLNLLNTSVPENIHSSSLMGLLGFELPHCKFQFCFMLSFKI